VKIALINPRQPVSLYGFTEAQDITDRPGHIMNLALPTLSALVPKDDDICLIDEDLDPIPFDRRWDVVGITGYVTQKHRMFAIADQFRKLGQLVAIGGSYASLSPEAVRPHADVVFIGEAEQTWPQFLADLRRGTFHSEYRSSNRIDVRQSPLPRLSQLNHQGYYFGTVQTSRGCPFECEFCDVIVYLGRQQRYKTPVQVVSELEQLYEAGYRNIFLADDNFTSNRRSCAELIQAIGEWNRSKPEPVQFVTQCSIEIARERDDELLRLCAAAGLKEIFIGIETSNPESLREVRKHQNLHRDLLSDVHRLQSHGILVHAGIITGFDSDTVNSFDRQYEFLQAAGIPMVLVSILNAPDGTPLEKRLLSQARLRPNPMGDMFLDTNIIPKNLTRDELLSGTRWLLNKLYAPEAFLERLRIAATFLPDSPRAAMSSPRGPLIWRRMLTVYENLGPEFRRLPYDALQSFRNKDVRLLGSALLFYRNAVGVLRKLQLWCPEGVSAL
jgi:radical SAM superfamily enzyme YgiQ (UPF0313 family)